MPRAPQTALPDVDRRRWTAGVCFCAARICSTTTVLQRLWVTTLLYPDTHLLGVMSFRYAYVAADFLVSLYWDLHVVQDGIVGLNYHISPLFCPG